MRSASRPLEVTGIVTHLGKLGEAHRLVEIFSAEEGRITLLARGARASRRRFGGVLELFNQIRVQSRVTSGPGLWPLDAAEIVRAPQGALKTSFAAIARAMGLVGVVRSLFPEREAAPEASAILTRALDYLDAENLARASGAYIHFARLSGVLPDLSRCGRCKRETLDLSMPPHAESLACRTCYPTGRPLSINLRRCLEEGRVGDIKTADEVEKFVAHLASQQGGRPVVLLPVL